MEEIIDDNKVIENDNDLEPEYKYNFINRPWDDRSIKSKVCLVALLIAIFTATMACVINNFVMHYRSFNSATNLNSEINCFRIKLNEYPFVARIHSLSSKKLICVGAVVSQTSVLASGVCVQNGPILAYMGSNANSRCKKGFLLEIIDYVKHDGIVSKRLVLLSSQENTAECAVPIRIGSTLDWKSKVQIIGRSSNVGWTLTRQLVSLTDKYFKIPYKNVNKHRMFCTKHLAKCPVKAGDLLIQRGFLFGLATTSVQIKRNTKACFANLTAVRGELDDLNLGINFESVAIARTNLSKT